jgi:hypothetical protein
MESSSGMRVLNAINKTIRMMTNRIDEGMMRTQNNISILGFQFRGEK